MSPQPITQNTLFYGDNLNILHQTYPFTSQRASDILSGEEKSFIERFLTETETFSSNL